MGRALVVGAGVGGLSAALALRRAGLDVLVFEQAREPREVGAGLMLWSNATRALRLPGRLWLRLLERLLAHEAGDDAGPP